MFSRTNSESQRHVIEKERCRCHFTFFLKSIYVYLVYWSGNISSYQRNRRLFPLRSGLKIELNRGSKTGVGKRSVFIRRPDGVCTDFTRSGRRVFPDQNRFTEWNHFLNRKWPRINHQNVPQPRTTRSNCNVIVLIFVCLDQWFPTHGYCIALSWTLSEMNLNFWLVASSKLFWTELILAPLQFERACWLRLILRWNRKCRQHIFEILIEERSITYDYQH